MQLINLPNILTLINLLAGCLALMFVYNFPNNFALVPFCTLISLVADFFDGFAARATKTNSEIGKQLDSLADVVSFGAVPGAILFQLLFQYFQAGDYDFIELYILAAPGYLVTLFAALRLAKFNIDTRQTDGFIGLATPAATIFVVGLLAIFVTNCMGLSAFVFNPYLLYATAVILPALMIAELPMFAFKFKGFGWKGNEVQYLFIILCVVLLATLKFVAIPIIIIVYVLTSIALKLIAK